MTRRISRDQSHNNKSAQLSQHGQSHLEQRRIALALVGEMVVEAPIDAAVARALLVVFFVLVVVRAPRAAVQRPVAHGGRGTHALGTRGPRSRFLGPQARSGRGLREVPQPGGVLWVHPDDRKEAGG